MTTEGTVEVEAQRPYKGRPNGSFPVMEMFGPTIQGEGAMIGIKTMFIRFGGCDFRCLKCDSLHAVMPEAVKAHAEWLTAEEIFPRIAQMAKESGTKWITLSGGNPAMWDLSLLVAYLKEAGFKIAVETQGTIWRDWLAQVNHLTISPKGPGMGEKFNKNVFLNFAEHIEESDTRLMGKIGVSIKVVVFDQRDFEFAVELDQLLDARGTRYWPKHHRYLSLGNTHPPKLNPETQKQELDPEVESVLIPTLLQDYKYLLEDFCNDRRLSEWVFLPQLHVLVWRNVAGV